MFSVKRLLHELIHGLKNDLVWILVDSEDWLLETVATINCRQLITRKLVSMATSWLTTTTDHPKHPLS